MERVEFRCMNCGYRVKKNILPTKHSVLGDPAEGEPERGVLRRTGVRGRDGVSPAK